jgi:hypothetical protein
LTAGALRAPTCVACALGVRPGKSGIVRFGWAMPMPTRQIRIAFRDRLSKVASRKCWSLFQTRTNRWPAAWDEVKSRLAPCLTARAILDPGNQRTMSGLRSFLEEHAPAQADRARRGMDLEEWKTALNSLMGRFEGWLRAADPKNALTIDRIPITIRERRLGTYDVEGLRVRFGVREFRVEPMARYALGSIAGDELGRTIQDGWVNMTSGDKGYVLYRSKRDDGDAWVIADDRTYEPRVLDESAFEDAALRLLK